MSGRPALHAVRRILFGRSGEIDELYLRVAELERLLRETLDISTEHMRATTGILARLGGVIPELDEDGQAAHW